MKYDTKSEARSDDSESDVNRDEQDLVTTVERVKELEQRVFDLAAKLNAEVGLSDEMINDLKRLLKRAKRTRRGGVQNRIEGVARQLTRMIHEIEGELEEAEIEIPEIDASVPGGAQASERSERLPTADEIEEQRKAELDRKVRVCMTMKRGLSAREALEHAGIEDRTARWARKIFQRYREEGMDALKDSRHLNGKSERVMTTEIKERVLRLWFLRPTASKKAIWTDLKDEINADIARGLLPETTRIPSYSSIRRFLAAQPKVMDLIRRGDLEDYRQKGQSIVPMSWTRYANDRWQGDTARLETWAKKLSPETGEWIVVEIWILALIDVHSRAIPAVVVQDAAGTGASVRRLYLKGVLPDEDEDGVHGLPTVIQTDNGSDYVSQEVGVALGELGIEHDIDPPNYPQRKGCIERWFQTLDRGLLRRLPGHRSAIGTTEEAAQKRVDELLTVDQIRTEIETWIHKEYHQRIHSQTKARPLERWKNTVRLREPESFDSLTSLWLNSNETRVIQPEGVKLTLDGEALSFWAPFCASRIREEVRVGFNEGDPSRIMIYSLTTGERLGWAFNPEHPGCPYDFEDVIRARRSTEATLRGRIERYHLINERERRRARAESPELQQDLIEELEKERSEGEESLEESAEARLERLEKEMRRQLMEPDQDEED